MPTEMTIRDHFAAAALSGLLAASDANSWADDLWADDLCRTAYGWADFMLRERANKPDSSPVTEPMPKEKRAEVSVTLTDAERVSIEEAAADFEDRNNIVCLQVAKNLRGLLERTK